MKFTAKLSKKNGIYLNFYFFLVNSNNYSGQFYFIMKINKITKH